MVVKRLTAAWIAVLLGATPALAQPGYTGAPAHYGGPPASYAEAPANWLTGEFSHTVRGCDGACDNACVHCRNWYVGVEATFLNPIFNDNPINYTFTDIAGATTTTITSDAASADYLGAAPRVWLGFAGNHGWGLVLRYWQLTTAGNGTDVLDPINIPGDITGFNASHVFKAYTLDLEGTRDFCYHNWDMLASFGVRHAAIERAESLTGLGLAGVDFLTASGVSERQFHGVGLTGSLAGNRPVGCCDLEWFYKVRGSVLWGDNDTLTTTAATVLGPGGSSFSVNGASASTNDDLFIGEFQTGLMWARDIQSVNSRVFASVAVEYQYWNAGEGDAASISAAGNAGVSSSTMSASSRNLRTHLVGFAIGAGYEW